MLTGLVSLPPAEAVVWAAVPLYGTSADFHDDPDPFNDGRLGRPWPWLRSWSAFQLPSARAFAVLNPTNGELNGYQDRLSDRPCQSPLSL